MDLYVVEGELTVVSRSRTMNWGELATWSLAPRVANTMTTLELSDTPQAIDFMLPHAIHIVTDIKLYRGVYKIWL